MKVRTACRPRGRSARRRSGSRIVATQESRNWAAYRMTAAPGPSNMIAPWRCRRPLYVNHWGKADLITWRHSQRSVDVGEQVVPGGLREPKESQDSFACRYYIAIASNADDVCERPKYDGRACSNQPASVRCESNEGVADAQELARSKSTEVSEIESSARLSNTRST